MLSRGVNNFITHCFENFIFKVLVKIFIDEKIMSDHCHVYERVRDYHKGIKPKSHFHSIELKINLPIFYGYNNVEEYLGREMKVEKLFEFHQVKEFRRLSMATSSFLEYVMSWWKQRQYDVSIGR